MRLFIVLGLAYVAALQKTGGLAVGDCLRYLLPDVADDKLTASTSWCQDDHISICTTHGYPDGHSPKYARLNSTGWYTGSWTPKSIDNQQYIQVDFGAPKWIAGVVLKARDYGPRSVTEYVTAFKVQTSNDCNTFQTVEDTDGEDKTFPGNTGLNDPVTNDMTTIVQARCVRINPTTWFGRPSLRFDIIGF